MIIKTYHGTFLGIDEANRRLVQLQTPDDEPGKLLIEFTPEEITTLRRHAGSEGTLISGGPLDGYRFHAHDLPSAFNLSDGLFMSAQLNGVDVLM